MLLILSYVDRAMPKYYRTVGVSIDKETYESFNKICELLGCSKHKVLKDAIEDLIERHREDVNESEKQGRPNTRKLDEFEQELKKS